ncbi:hypothetical protein NDU88_003444 [Pleurodeles waltl]|uniref:Secreted protein n=1 Tax=Pleurodeles waltl TaxID=8319 RepID=A0AAV7M710_PLEWA|nr:hypothetical protein NDU88_003444 [Pleurodeles waltl]
MVVVVGGGSWAAPALTDGCMVVVVWGGSWAAPVLTDGCLVVVVGVGSWAAPALTDGCTSTAGGEGPVTAAGGGCVSLTASVGEEETGDAPVAAVDPEDSEDEEAEDEDVDNRPLVISQYFQ